MRVLIVEDDLIVGMLIEEMVIGLGDQPVGPAESVTKALSLVGECDFAILDVRIVGGDVYPVADALRARNIPFCFSSGLDDIDYPNAQTLRKPFELSDLRAMMEQYRHK